MRIIAIDASPIYGGPASYAVDVASSAAEEAGADVIRIRLYDLHTYCCTECGACESTGRCTKRDGLLEHAARVLQAADAIVVGAPARLNQKRQGAQALLQRLLGAYTGNSSQRGRRGASTFAEGKRGAVIPSCSSAMGFPIGSLGMARAAKKQLAEAGVDVLECPCVPARFDDPAARDITRQRAEAVGRLIAGAEKPGGGGPPQRRRRRRSRVSPLLSPDTAL
jgi:multimeric flavodoxin WrbA